MSKRSLHFIGTGRGDYTYWQKTDKEVLQKINPLLSEMQRTPFAGVGKPEPLRESLTGSWARRIDAQTGLHRER